MPKDVSNLKAVVISDQATITFDESKGADGYRVYYKKGTKLKSLGTSSKPSCSVTLPECGKTYTIVIKAYKKQGDTTLWSKGISAEISSGPEAVTGIKESSNFYAIKLTWDKGDSADGYRVYIRKSDGTFKILTTTTKTSYTVTGLSGGTKYTFAFKAYRKVDAKTIWGKTVKKTAETSSAKPSSFSAKEGTYEVTLSWREVKGAKGYKVYRYDSKKKKYITVATVKENSYTVENLSSGTTYKFAVKAYAEKDKKTYYGEAVYLTVTTKLKKPTLTVKVTSKGNALSWKAVGGADSYEIYRSYEKDGKYTKIKTTSNLNFTDTSANKNKTCYYKIRSCKTVNGITIKSSFSTVKKAAR